MKLTLILSLIAGADGTSAHFNRLSFLVVCAYYLEKILDDCGLYHYIEKCTNYNTTNYVGKLRESL